MKMRRQLLNWLHLLLLISFTAVAAPACAAEALDLSKYRGKVVLVDFWASWCTPCRHSFPWLNAMHRKYGERGLVVIGVNVDRDRAEAQRFLRDTPAQFELIYDPTGALAEKQGVMGMPSSYVFDPNGELLSTHIGFKKADRERREAELLRLLPQP